MASDGIGGVEHQRQQSAEVFMDCRGHVTAACTFADFMLFTVEVDQKDNLPREPAQP